MKNPVKNPLKKMKKRILIRIAIVAVFLLLAGFLASCSKKSLVDVKPVKKAKVGEEFVVQKSESKTPKWTENPEFQIVKEKGEKFIYVTAEIYGQKEKRAAERIAESELRKKIAEGIKTLVQSQFGEAIKGTNETYSESFNSYVVTVAENVPVVGLVVTDTYWEKIQRIKSESEVEYIYRVIKRGKMPYNNYKAARDMAWQDVIDRAANEDEKQELRRLVEEMKREDAA